MRGARDLQASPAQAAGGESGKRPRRLLAPRVSIGRGPGTEVAALGGNRSGLGTTEELQQLPPSASMLGLAPAPAPRWHRSPMGEAPADWTGDLWQRVCACVQHLPMCARRVGERPEQGGARVWGSTQHGGGKPCRARGALRPMSRGPEHLCCRQACPKASWVPRSVHSSKRHRRDTKPAHVPSLALLDA